MKYDFVMKETCLGDVSCTLTPVLSAYTGTILQPKVKGNFSHRGEAERS